MLVRTLDDSTLVRAPTTETADLVASLELLTLVQGLSQAFGSELGVDISRPGTIPHRGSASTNGVARFPERLTDRETLMGAGMTSRRRRDRSTL